MIRPFSILFVLILATGPTLGQDRDTKVRNDRASFEGSKEWIYNDLGEGIRAAKENGKPLMVVFRCIPCQACQKFDDDVARRDPIVRDLLDEFVCVRIVQANTIDLTTFQHDFDQSFAVYLMNPDRTIYGRFGTRSGRPESEDISLHGLRKAMEAALVMHRGYAAIKSSLAGKQVRQTRFRKPTDYPSLSGRFGEKIDYEGAAAKSCMHCHQIGEAQRLVYRSERQPIPDEVLFPYPDPSVLGLRMDPTARATVMKVEPGSVAERAGIRDGDEIARLASQVLISIADLQWVLHNTPSAAKLAADVIREGRPIPMTLDLPEGWRRGDISWRATSWDLRRMGLGGLYLEDVSDAQRAEARLKDDALALRVRHAGEYGEHAAAKRAGVTKGDIVVEFDGLDRRMTESELLAYTLQKKRPGDQVTLVVLRDGERKTLTFALQ